MQFGREPAIRGRRTAWRALGALFCALATTPAAAQQEAQDVAVSTEECRELLDTPSSGLYTTVWEGGAYVQRGEEVVELQFGQSGFVDERLMACLRRNPEFFLQDAIPRPSNVLPAECGVGGLDTWQPLRDFRAINSQRQNEVEEFLRRGYPPYSVLWLGFQSQRVR